MRSPTFERQMLEEVARAAGLWGVEVERFTDAVNERLKMGEREYGDNFSDRSPGELLREIAEEGEDVAAWALLAAQRIHGLALEGFDADEAAEINGLLIAAAASGLQSWSRVKRAEKTLKTARAHAGWREKVPAAPATCSEP
jgi:hypothetical protein